MSRLHRISALTAATAVLCAGPALAAPATVNVRLEGSSTTLFEGALTTDAKTLTKDGTGPHPCDGTNGGANPQPGPTMAGAMDDGTIAAGFTWDGTWDAGFQDFFISRIGPDTNTGAPNYQPYWGYFLNWVASSIGACQQQVVTGDKVLFAYANFGQPLLELAAPSKAATGEAVTVSVEQHDGNGNHVPAVGASVEGQTTDAGGQAQLSFDSPGVKTFKASRADAVRSNSANVCVYVAGSGDCGTEKAGGGTGEPAPADPNVPAQDPVPAAKDSTAPVVTVGSPKATTYARGPRLLEGAVDEDRSIQQVFLRLRVVDHGARTSKNSCRWFSAKREVFTHRTVPCEKARFFRVGDKAKWSYLLPERLRSGGYVLDVKVIDRALNAGRKSVSFSVR